MTATFNLGSNYSFEEDSNGDLVITDSTGTPVIKHEDGADSISAVAPFDAIDADIGKLLKNLDANSQDINNIGALEADSAINTSVGDSVDYLNPLWVVESDYYNINEKFDSLDSFGQRTTGSGVIKNDAFELTLDTGSTSGSSAEIDKRPLTTIVEGDWDKDNRLAVAANFKDAMTGRTDYITVGRPFNDTQGYGFKVNNGDIIGVAHDGASETTTTLVSGASTGERKFRAEFDSRSEIRFIINGTQQGTISSGLPTTGSNQALEYQLRVENSTAAQRRMSTSEFRMVQSP